MKTMHEEYGEPNDKLGKHLVCEKCGSCKTCPDCKKYGCGVSQKIKVKTWRLFTEFGVDAFFWTFDSSTWDVTDDELSLCIQEQIYGVDEK